MTDDDPVNLMTSSPSPITFIAYDLEVLTCCWQSEIFIPRELTAGIGCTYLEFLPPTHQATLHIV